MGVRMRDLGGLPSLVAAAIVVLSSASSSSARAADCGVVPACPAVAIEPGPRRPFRHAKSHLTTTLGSPRHRARDLFQREGLPQWLNAKFTYGKLHKDLEGEDIDVWVLRGCAGAWEKIGTAQTNADDTSPAIDGAFSGSGRVSIRVPDDKVLGVGLHRVRFVVAGDGSSVDALAEILAPSARFFVSDVDGTLTSSEEAELAHVIRGSTPDAHRDAPRVLATLVERGFRPLYLSARADWLTERTREFLAYRGFPLGAVRVTNGHVGERGGDAAAFKSAELARLGSQGLVPSFGFGNKPSDTTAYERANISPVTRRFFLGVTDPKGGRRFESYTELLPEVRGLACP